MYIYLNLPLNKSYKSVWKYFRVLREVEGIKTEAASLKEQMQMVKDVIKGVCVANYYKYLCCLLIICSYLSYHLMGLPKSISDETYSLILEDFELISDYWFQIIDFLCYRVSRLVRRTLS